MIYAKFLTNAPLTKLIRDLEFEQLSILAYGIPVSSLRGVLDVVPVTGSTAKEVTAATTVIGGRLTLCIKLPNTYTFSAVKSLTAYLESKSVSGGITTWTRCTEQRFYTMDKTTRLRAYRIGFVNLLGGIDYHTFYGAETKTASVSQITVQKELPTPFVSSDRGEKALSSVYGEAVEVFSDFITETTALWLSELMSSPEVWRVEAGLNIPIVVTMQSQTIKSNDMIQMQLTFRDANQRITQNG